MGTICRDPTLAVWLPAGSPEVELILTAGFSARLPGAAAPAPRACPAAGTPAGILIVFSLDIRRRSPLMPHSQSRLHLLRLNTGAPASAPSQFNPLTLFYFQKLCLEEYEKHRQCNYLQRTVFMRNRYRCAFFFFFLRNGRFL